ncbi:MAG: PilZ domain-containing protein [Magnetococcales bacterium]|nr:PilZ domain-containing protein [Magnetococcales bacterium]
MTGHWRNSLWDQVLPEPERRQEPRETAADRRRAQRFGFYHPARLETLNGKQVQGYTQDASLHGLFLTPMAGPGGTPVDFQSQIKPGDSATLRIQVEGGPVEFTCRVVRVDRKGIALEALPGL